MTGAWSSILWAGESLSNIWHESTLEYVDSFDNEVEASHLVEIDSTRPEQSMIGFGGTLTNLAAYLIYKSPNRKTIVAELFGPQGAGLNLIRLPMGCTDSQAVDPYTYNDLPGGMTDYDLNKFSIDKDKEFIIPLLKIILKVNPKIQIMAVPWTAPAWMKSGIDGTCGTLNGGKLNMRQNMMEAYALYFVSFIQAYKSENIIIHSVSVQNKPMHQTDKYPSMKMEFGEMSLFVRDHLGPMFQVEMINTEIVIYDDVWNHVWYPNSLLADGGTPHYVSGIAFQCGSIMNFAGVVELMHRNHPGKHIYLTECSPFTLERSQASQRLFSGANVIANQTHQGAQAVFVGNLAVNTTKVQYCKIIVL